MSTTRLLIPDWREVLKKAWSIRLSLLAALCGGIEVVLSITDFGLPQGIFLGLSFIFSVSTPIARLLAQRDSYVVLQTKITDTEIKPGKDVGSHSDRPDSTRGSLGGS